METAHVADTAQHPSVCILTSSKINRESYINKDYVHIIKQKKKNLENSKQAITLGGLFCPTFLILGWEAIGNPAIAKMMPPVVYFRISLQQNP